MKLNRLVFAGLVLVLAGGLAFAQAADGEAFLNELKLELAASGWSEEEIAAFDEAASELDWAGAGNADPQMIARALAYGMSENAVAVQEQARMALALAQHTAEMKRLGYSDRDVATAAMTATRSAVQSMSQVRRMDGEQVGDLVRDRLNEALQEQTRTITRTRSGNSSGNSYRLNESQPGVPFSPDDPARPGGPGDAPADGSGAGQQ